MSQGTSTALLVLTSSPNYVGRYVLKQILSGEATEVVVEKVHEYLSSVGEGVRSGKVALDDFIIWKVRMLTLDDDVLPCLLLCCSDWARTPKTILMLRASRMFRSLCVRNKEASTPEQAMSSRTSSASEAMALRPNLHRRTELITQMNSVGRTLP